MVKTSSALQTFRLASRSVSAAPSAPSHCVLRQALIFPYRLSPPSALVTRPCLPLQIRHKSKRARATSVETPPHSTDDPSAVPVLNTKGKGSKGARSRSSPHATKSKHGGAEREGERGSEEGGGAGAGFTEEDRREDHVEGENFNLEQVGGNMKRALERCEGTVRQLVGRLGRADPSLLDSVKVSYPSEGEEITGPLKDYATVGSRDGALLITLYDPDMAKHVVRAILQAELDLNPQTVANDHETLIRIPIARPTSETRTALLKDISRVCENARISIRSARQIGLKKLKKDVDDKIVGTSEAHAEGKKLEAETKKATSGVDAVYEQYKKKVEAESE